VPDGGQAWFLVGAHCQQWDRAPGETSFVGTEQLEAMVSPRIIKTHIPAHILPKSFWENRCKVMAGGDTPGGTGQR